MTEKKLEAAAHEAGHLTVTATLTGACTARMVKNPDDSWGGITLGGPDVSEGDPIEWSQWCNIAGPCGEWCYRQPDCKSAEVLAAICRGDLELNESDRAHASDSEQAIGEALRILRDYDGFFRWAVAELYAHDQIEEDAVCKKLEEFDLC